MKAWLKTTSRKVVDAEAETETTTGERNKKLMKTVKGLGGLDTKLTFRGRMRAFQCLNGNTEY
ncbi:hypothetical protein F511_46830 [Dorcoceras hygrometricum]|uniref:Uncharacterized protein n=1 Tax=Dorcoceras hygrometricum TaxID=472368 RepID=A0A2Z6ZSK6_9LAMI|nr:hypothetical protein F511_46830 [Dorcoceras hygrometricum]